MKKLLNLLNYDKLFTVLNDIKNNANFGISLLDDYKSVKSKIDLKNVRKIIIHFLIIYLLFNLSYFFIY